MPIQTITNGVFNTEILRYDSKGFKVTPSIDFTGYTLKYFVKKHKTDADIDSIIDLVPEVITENDLKKIIITFVPSDFNDISTGTYYHALKAISTNEQTAITIFKGELSIIQDYIKNSIVEA